MGIDWKVSIARESRGVGPRWFAPPIPVAIYTASCDWRNGGKLSDQPTPFIFSLHMWGARITSVDPTTCVHVSPSTLESSVSFLHVTAPIGVKTRTTVRKSNPATHVSWLVNNSTQHDTGTTTKREAHAHAHAHAQTVSVDSLGKIHRPCRTRKTILPYFLFDQLPCFPFLLLISLRNNHGYASSFFSFLLQFSNSLLSHPICLLL